MLRKSKRTLYACLSVCMALPLATLRAQEARTTEPSGGGCGTIWDYYLGVAWHHTGTELPSQHEGSVEWGPRENLHPEDRWDTMKEDTNWLGLNSIHDSCG